MLPKARRRGCGKVGIPRALGGIYKLGGKACFWAFPGSVFSTPIFRLQTIVVQRTTPGAEPAVCHFVDAFQFAINGPGQLERIQSTLELLQIRQAAGLGGAGTRRSFDPTRVFFTIFTEGK